MNKIREEKKYQGNNIDNEPVYSIFNIYGNGYKEIAKDIIPSGYEWRGKKYTSCQICKMHNQKALNKA